MLAFRYTATTSKGRDVCSFLWFPSFIPPPLAYRISEFILARVFVKVSSLQPEPTLSLRASSDAVALFTRRLAVMVAAGIPLHEAIIFLSESEDEQMNVASRKLGQMISSGNSFAHSLSQLPGVFPSFFVGFARAGESSGRLVEVLDKLATQTERSLWIRRRVRTALSYPFFLALGAILLSGLLIFSIVPMMAPTLQEMNVELPWITKALLGFTDIGSNPLVLLSTALLFLTSFLAVSFVMSQTGRFSRARRYLDQALLELPLSKRLTQQYSSARVLSAVGLSLETGIPVTRALLEASLLAPNVMLEERIAKVCDTIAEGTPFEEALDESDAFSPTEIQILICASEAGNLADGMNRMAALAEEQMETTLGVLTSLVEPMILALMSFVVGVVSLATFLPWVNLLQSIF